MKLKDKLWNWGHLEGSHNECTGLCCHMTPEDFAKEYGIPNAFVVSYGGNIKPPFDAMAGRLSSLSEIKWSVLGDASTPLPDAELGNTEDILAILNSTQNVTGGVVDDFFSPERMKRFPPEVLKKIKTALNEKGLDFWCVLYDHQLDLDLRPYLKCFDGVTFWIWECENIAKMDEYLPKIVSLAEGKKLMGGIYLWDYDGKHNCPMDARLFEDQLSRYFAMVKSGALDGVIFCSSTVGDADLPTHKILKDYIEKYGDDTVL